MAEVFYGGNKEDKVFIGSEEDQEDARYYELRDTVAQLVRRGKPGGVVLTGVGGIFSKVFKRIEDHYKTVKSPVVRAKYEKLFDEWCLYEYDDTIRFAQFK